MSGTRKIEVMYLLGSLFITTGVEHVWGMGVSFIVLGVLLIAGAVAHGLFVVLTGGAA